MLIACGVAVERAESPERWSTGSSVAAAKDPSDAAAADLRFAAIFLATSLPTQDPDAFPSCARMIRQIRQARAAPWGSRHGQRNPDRAPGLL